MERVRSKKLGGVAPEEVVRVPVVLPPSPTFSGRVVPARDPAKRSRFMLDGYGQPKKAFSIGDKKQSVTIYFRVRQTESEAKEEVRVYYAGKILLGSACLTPMLITGSFDHNMEAEPVQKYKSEAELHDALRLLLLSD